MVANEQSSAFAVIERLAAAQNAHDLEAFVQCFDVQYRSEQPVHPSWAFSGVEQVRANWSEVFAGVPDFRAELVRWAAADDEGWAEWHWEGTRADGTRLEMRGVTIFGIEDGRIAWGRLYMEPVEQPGRGIDEGVERMTSSEPD